MNFKAKSEEKRENTSHGYLRITDRADLHFWDTLFPIPPFLDLNHKGFGPRISVKDSLDGIHL